MNKERKGLNSKETIQRVADDMTTVQEEQGGAEDPQQHDEMDKSEDKEVDSVAAAEHYPKAATGTTGQASSTTTATATSMTTTTDIPGLLDADTQQEPWTQQGLANVVTPTANLVNRA
jgi:hypothetical protein